MPKVSVNLGSNRPGGIDVALAGLVNQTFQDFEVIFVDGRYHERHTRVMEAVKESGLKQPFIHVPNHRYRGDIWGSTCAGYNTGFMLSAGEIVVMLLDYGYAPPNWLEEHVKHHQGSEKKIVMGPHEYRSLRDIAVKGSEPIFKFHSQREFKYEDGTSMSLYISDGTWWQDYFVSEVATKEAIGNIRLQRTRFDEISIFRSPFVPERLSLFSVEESDAKCGMKTGPSDYTYFNTKNESFPLENVLQINGMDETYDRGRGPGDPDLAIRLSRTGLQPWIVREATVHCLNPRGILPNLNIVIPDSGRLQAPYNERWYIQDGYDYFEPIKKGEVIRAPNPFDIQVMREKLWGWRTMSQNSNPIIPRVVIPDDLYYVKQ